MDMTRMMFSTSSEAQAWVRNLGMRLPESVIWIIIRRLAVKWTITVIITWIFWRKNGRRSKKSSGSVRGKQLWYP